MPAELVEAAIKAVTTVEPVQAGAMVGWTASVCGLLGAWLLALEGATTEDPLVVENRHDGTLSTWWVSKSGEGNLLLARYMDSPDSSGSTNGAVIRKNTTKILPGFPENWGSRARKWRKNETKECDTEQVMKKLWMSADLMNNLVTVLGYLINKPWAVESVDLYSALQLVFQCVKHRRISTLEMLKSLKAMSSEAPQEQYILLFGEMERIICKEGRGAVGMLLESLKSGVTNVTSQIGEVDGGLVVDILANIELDSVQEVAKPLAMNRETRRSVDGSTAQQMGPTFADIFACVTRVGMRITQPVVAAILLHLPADRLRPETEEAVRFLADIMRENKIGDWDKVLANLERDSEKSPFWLIRSIMQTLADRKLIHHPLVNDAAETCASHIHPPTVWSLNPNLAAMSPIVSSPTVNIKLLLSYVTAEDFPPDIVECKDHIIRVINEKELDMNVVTRGFNRFQDETPIVLLISLLNRMRLRMANILTTDLMDSIKALNAYVMYKVRSTQWSVENAGSMAGLTILLEAAGSPTLPESIREPQARLLQSLPKEVVDWEKVLHPVGALRCNSARRCLVLFLRNTIQKGFLVGTKSIEPAVALLNALNINGEPMDSLTTPTTAYISTRMHTKKRLRTFVHTPPNRSSSLTTPRPTITTTAKPPLDWRPQRRNVSELYPEPQSFIHDFVAQEHLPQILGPVFNTSAYNTLGQMLGAILEKAFASSHVQEYTDLYREITAYVLEINAVSKAYLQQITKIQIQRRLARLENIPDYPALDVLLKSDGDVKKKKVVLKFLNRPDLPSLLGPTFKPHDLLNKGQLLESLLSHALTLEEVQNDEPLLQAIRYYVDKVVTKGPGSQAVSWISGRSRALDLNKAFNSIADEVMNEDQLRHLDRLFSFFSHQFNHEVHLAGFNVFVFRTYGQLMQMLLRHLKELDIVNDDVKEDIEAVYEFVRLTGHGLEPIGLAESPTEVPGENASR